MDMSKPSRHPLPVDSQVVAAIEDRQLLLRQKYAEKISIKSSVEDSWIWHHLFTVLDHAKKIFETPVEELEKTEFETK